MSGGGMLSGMMRGLADARAELNRRGVDGRWTPRPDPTLGGQGPAPGYAMSLSEEKRARLRDDLRTSLPIADDGSIELIARAWAVRGTKAVAQQPLTLPSRARRR